MAQTASEIIFERFCVDIGLPCAPVPCGNHRTPDYDLTLSGHIVIAEVKQLDRNDEDNSLIAKARDTGVAVGWPKTDVRIRRKTKDAGKQLKARSKGQLPALAVIYDNGTFGDIDFTDIKTAMFGDEQVVVSVLDSGIDEVTPLHAGGGRQMTDEWNTTISAVALLLESAGLPSMSMFHNHFARNPIDPDWFRHERLRHFKLATDRYDWSPI